MHVVSFEIQQNRQMKKIRKVKVRGGHRCHHVIVLWFYHACVNVNLYERLPPAHEKRPHEKRTLYCHKQKQHIAPSTQTDSVCIPPASPLQLATLRTCKIKNDGRFAKAPLQRQRPRPRQDDAAKKKQ